MILMDFTTNCMKILIRHIVLVDNTVGQGAENRFNVRIVVKNGNAIISMIVTVIIDCTYVMNKLIQNKTGLDFIAVYKYYYGDCNWTRYFTRIVFVKLIAGFNMGTSHQMTSLPCVYRLRYMKYGF